LHDSPVCLWVNGVVVSYGGVVLLKLRDLWSPVVLAVVGVSFLLVGGPTREALAGAGFALAGAAVTRAVDIAQGRRREQAEEDRRRREDLDETRRLAYMVLVTGTAPGHPELVATVANALAHHGEGVPFQVAAAHLATVANGGAENESGRWLQDQVDRITRTLDA
jgi:hypothetical protein